jgi:hypothetical protein
MRMQPTCATLRPMSSYAVLWKKENALAQAGRLELDPYGIWLHGGLRGQEVRVEIPYSEIEAVEHTRRDRIGPCRALCVHTRCNGEVMLATLGGPGVLGEILDFLRAGCTRMGLQ